VPRVPASRTVGEARRAKAGGVVVLEVTISAEGEAQDIKFVKTPGYRLEEKAVEAVRTWKFKPAMAPGGKPVAVRAFIEVSFQFR
jgi:protein TonB